MIILPHEQRSEEWFAARLGLPTASQFGKIITATGKKSAQFDGYANQLIAERITGEITQVTITEAMQRGTDLEPQARAWYELATGETVVEVGLCLHDHINCGASPDGLVGDHGLLEIKCPMAKTMVEYLRDGVLPSAYVPQVQGQLWITDREWCDFLAWHPAMKPLTVKVERDPKYIEKLAELVSALDDVITENYLQMRIN